MLRYIARRLLVGLLTASVVSILVFALLRIAVDQELFVAIEPIGGVSLQPAEEVRWAIRERLGLNAPLYIQYFSWVGGLASGDWGESMFSGEAIWEKFMEGLPATLQLVAMALTIAVLLGVPAGIIMALRRNSWLDLLGRAVFRTWLTLPIFWTATLLLVAGIRFLEWSPKVGYIPPLEDPRGNLILFVWPALVLGIPAATAVALMMRSVALDALRQDYVMDMTASEPPHPAMIFLFTLKHTLAPAAVILALTFPAILGGMLIMERVFVLDGVGRMLNAALNERDFPVIESLALFFSVWVIAVNTLVDILCGWLTPDVRSSGKSPREEWNHLADPVRLV